MAEIASDDEVKKLRGVIERLASMEAFTQSRTIKPEQDDELLARIDFARTAAREWNDADSGVAA